MPYEVIALDRETASMPHTEIRKVVLELGEGELTGSHIPMEIESLDELADVLDGWGMKAPARSSPFDVEGALDRWQVWICGRVAVRQVRGVHGEISSLPEPLGADEAEKGPQ
jgi:hypothetical protein